MFGTKRTGSVLCPSCGKLVGVNDEVCLNCGRRRPGMWGLTSVLGRLGRDMGFVQVVIGGCVLLYLLMLAVDTNGIQMGGNIFSIGSPSNQILLRFGASGRFPVFIAGHWWTLLSAGWLHAGLLHIGFNLYWVRILAPETAELYGPARMVILYTISSITGFLLSSAMAFVPIPLLHGADLTVGASAPILGLLGAMVYYGRRSGSRHVGGQAWSYALFMIVFGFFMPGVDNWAHIGGFAGGYLGGMLLDPLHPERGNHQALAAGCLIATAAAVLASLVLPIPLR